MPNITDSILKFVNMILFFTIIGALLTVISIKTADFDAKIMVFPIYGLIGLAISITILLFVREELESKRK